MILIQVISVAVLITHGTSFERERLYKLRQFSRRYSAVDARPVRLTSSSKTPIDEKPSIHVCRFVCVGKWTTLAT